jgi:hypothetical protein
MKWIIYVLWGLVGIVPAGCEKVEKITGPGQPVCFEYRYVNYAWGYQEKGWLIDSSGNINSYNLPDGFILPDSTGLITGDNLAHNLALTDSVIGTVPGEDMDYYLGLIQGASEGIIGAPRSIAADAGNSVLSCYRYDSAENAYRYVFLGRSGDWEQFNQSEEAEILIDWLKQFGVFWLSE